MVNKNLKIPWSQKVLPRAVMFSADVTSRHHGIMLPWLQTPQCHGHFVKQVPRSRDRPGFKKAVIVF